MLTFTGERIVPEADNCEPLFALKMYQEHIARYLFASQHASAKSVLDVGCGIGYGSHLLARRSAAAVTAFDISPEAIEHAREFYPHSNLKYLVASAEEFSFSEQFDLITCFELIEHLQHQHRALDRIAASLKSDGLLFISTPRPVGKMRSAFHAKELSFLEFSNLLSTYFPYVEWLFENNHFASLIANATPERIDAVYSLRPQFALGQADYFIAVASHSPIKRESLRDQLVLNDDAYVRNLERDVEILHKAEHDLQAKLHALTAQTEEAISQKQAAFHQEQEALRQRQEAFEEKQRALQQKQQEHTKYEDLQNQLRLALSREEDLNQRVAALEPLSAELEIARKNTTELRTKIAELEAAGSESRTNINSLSEQLANYQQKEARMRAQLANAKVRAERQTAIAKRELAPVISDLANARERIRNLESERDALRATADSEHVRAQSLEARANEFELRFNSVVLSRSWRITNPLRNLIGKVRGHAHDPLGVGQLQNGQPKTEDLIAARTNVTSQSEVDGDHDEEAIRIPSRPSFDVLYIIGCHDGESKRYRVHNLVESLTQLGYKAESWPQEEIPRILDEAFSSRVVVLFRCAYDEQVERLLQYCKENSITSIFDIDDLVFEPENIDFVRVVKTFSETDRRQYLRGVERYRKTLLECDWVTCTTAFLAKRVSALQKRAHVVPNSLNEQQLEIARGMLSSPTRNRDDIRIGYFSGSNTHQVDFEACETALLTVMDRYPDVRFVLVGILELKHEWDRFSDRIERHPMLPFEQMLSLLSTIDINLAPLEVGNPYCESKSQLKIFEAGLVETPTVASATESYGEAISHEYDGFLAASTEEWIAAIERLVGSTELRRSMGERARERALSQFGPESVARRAVDAYELPAKPRISDHWEHTHLKITWIVPGLLIGGGGHRNILRTAYYLEQFGHEIELYFTSLDWSAEQIRDAVHTHFYPLECPMHRYTGEINPTDVLFATHWSTVDIAMKARAVASDIMYFVQDFEPAFAPMGTEYILAENTYRLGLYHITSGPWCEAVLKQNFNCEVDHFLFPVDRSIYHPKPRSKQNTNIIFFAKPEMPRRCFDLGIMALEQFHELCPDVEIILFGSRHLEGVGLQFPATIRSLLPTIEDLAQLYADADLGIVFSTTNPSLVPYEMMACGLPVVDLGRPGNEVNYASRYDVAFLADPVPETMARQIQELIQDRAQLRERSRKGLELVQTFPSEEEMARRVEELILKRVSKQRKALVAVA